MLTTTENPPPAGQPSGLSAIEGDTVVDHFMGSATTGIACLRTGRKFIGCEKDPTHFATACDRIRQELTQGDFFASPNTDSAKTFRITKTGT